MGITVLGPFSGRPVKIRDQDVGRATLMEKRGAIVSSRTLFDANTPVLPGFAKSAGFVF